MRCSRWDELEFVKFCEAKLSQSEIDNLHAHMDECADCRDSFITAWNLLTQENYSRIEHESAGKIVNSERWQSYQQEMARKHANAVRANLQSERAKSSNRLDAIKPVTTYFSNRTFLTAAAILLAIILPLSGIYLILNKSDKGTGKSAENRLKTKITGETDDEIDDPDNPIALANAFEQANKKLAANPNDNEALFERADKLENLYLLEAAKEDYQHYLALTGTSRHGDAQLRLASLTERLDQPVKPTPTRYERLDQDINNYLEKRLSRDSQQADFALTAAQTLADEMEQKTGDRIGQDLVGYYRHISAEAAEPLLNARRERAKYEATGVVDNYGSTIKAIEEINKVFVKYQAAFEIELTDIQKMRFLTKISDYQQVDLIFNKYLDRAIAAKHLFSQAQLRLRQGENKSNISKFDESIAFINEADKIAAPLDVPEFSLIPLIYLAGVSYVSNNNERAFIEAQKGMIAAHKINKPIFQIQLSQILGISAFNQNYQLLAEEYLNHSIKVAKDLNKPAYLTISYSFLGIIRAEQSRFKESEEDFIIADQLLTKLEDEAVRINASFLVKGYHARATMLKGDAHTAVILYHEAIDFGNKGNIRQKLFLSQLHQGLGESLINAGDRQGAEAELIIATNFAREARANSEENNTLLTFAVTKRDPEEQLFKLQQTQ